MLLPELIEPPRRPVRMKDDDGGSAGTKPGNTLVRTKEGREKYMSVI